MGVGDATGVGDAETGLVAAEAAGVDAGDGATSSWEGLGPTAIEQATTTIARAVINVVTRIHGLEHGLFGLGTRRERVL